MNRSFYTAAISLSLLLSATAASANDNTLRNGASIYGKSSAIAAATQVVDVNTAKNLRVPCGETVTFRNGDKTFTWKFDVVAHRPVDLKAIAPEGFVDKAFTVYTTRNVMERT